MSRRGPWDLHVTGGQLHLSTISCMPVWLCWRKQVQRCLAASALPAPTCQRRHPCTKNKPCPWKHPGHSACPAWAAGLLNNTAERATCRGTAGLVQCRTVLLSLTCCHAVWGFHGTILWFEDSCNLTEPVACQSGSAGVSMNTWSDIFELSGQAGAVVSACA